VPLALMPPIARIAGCRGRSSTSILFLRALFGD